MKKKSMPEVPLAEQVANVLDVAKRMEGRYVIQKRELGKWKRALLVNPLMSDGGLQPPGPPLYGTPTYRTQAEAEAVISQRVARGGQTHDPETYLGGTPYTAKEYEGRWGVAWNYNPTKYPHVEKPFQFFESEQEARSHAQEKNSDAMNPPVLRVVSAPEDCLLTTVYPRTKEGKARYGSYPTLQEVIAKTPQVVDLATPSKDAHLAPNWVSNLNPDEPVDVILDRKCSGISEDCFITTAGELFAAGYGELHFERAETGVTVYADTLDLFDRMLEATG